MSGDGLAVHRVASGSMADRAAAIVIEELAHGAAPAELAVLARVNSALLPVQVALTEKGIAHTAPLDISVLQRTGVRTALAYLRLGLDTDRLRREDVFDTLNRPARKVKSAVTPHLPRGSRWSIRALEQVCEQLDGTHRERFAGYLDDLRHLEAAITDGADTARCLWVVRNRIGLGEAMDALDASRTRPEGSSHGDDLDALEQLATLQPDPAAFAGWLVERLRVPGEATGVTLSTVHRVKGMEWPTVVVFAANQGLFPHRLADDQEEERRVFHVAITRCQRSLHVISDQARTSPFVEELARTTSAGATEPGRRAEPVPNDELTTAAPSFLPDGRLRAAVGVQVTLPGGLAGRICKLGRHHVVVELDEEEGERPVVRIAHGAQVQVAGNRRVLGPATGPGTRGVDRPEPDDALFEALRAWRSKVAARNGVPAYLVFHDRHLQVLAGRKPTTLTELGACPGIGPAKLERYGDDLLDLVADHLV